MSLKALFTCSNVFLHVLLAPNSLAKFNNTAVIKFKVKNQSDVDVSRFGAKGDGINDDTQAIQNAINYAKSNNKSTVLFPNGRYKLSKASITVKQGILLKGIDKIPAKSGFGSDLCQFEISFGENDVNSPAFIMESFSGMAGFSFLYPKQSFKSNVPTPYGWTITTNGKSSQDAITLRNLMLSNSYLGIKLDNGGQHSVENIYGQPIKTGIYIDRQYDVLRVSNIHFWPFYSQPGQPLYKWIEANGNAIVLNRTDGLQGANWFVYGYHRGLLLTNKGFGAPWFTVNNILFDVCQEPILIDAINSMTLNNVTLTGSNVAIAQAGVLISNKVKDINSLIQINGLTTVNLTNSLINQGVCTIAASMKSKVYDGKNNGVRWYDVINENDSAIVSINTPLQPGNEYKRISGKMQINGAYSYQDITDITPAGFNEIYNWSESRNKVSLVKGASRFNLIGGLAVVSYLLPKNLFKPSGVYILEMTIKVHSNTSALGMALFYPRLRDYSKNIDFSLTPYIGDPYFTSATKLKIPFLISGDTVYLDFVFGRATNAESAYIDVTGMKLYQASGTQTAFKEVMPKHQNYN